jgi:hypothetical protein
MKVARVTVRAITQGLIVGLAAVRLTRAGPGGGSIGAVEAKAVAKGDLRGRK